MNLTTLPLPTTSAGLIQAADDYYWSFYLEMVRMSNPKLASYVEKYLNLIYQLSKSMSVPDMIRAAIGCFALHRFGYRDFDVLANVFDRTVPQTDPEYVAFTSYVANRLTHHPNIEQSRYVQHLLYRTLGWMRAKGRRARPLAAATMIEAIAMNAGSSISNFLPQFQSSIWLLVSHKSVQVLQETAKTISSVTLSITRYARADLDSYLLFLTQLCSRLLSFGSPIRIYASLILLEQLINVTPNFFLNQVLNLYNSIVDVTEGSHTQLKCYAYVTCANFSKVDKKFFAGNIADELFEKTPELLQAYPNEIVNALGILLENIPKWSFTKLDIYKKYVGNLLETKDGDDYALKLLSFILEAYGEKAFPLENELISKLLHLPLTESYRNCFVNLTKIKNVNLEKDISLNIISKINSEIKGNKAALVLKFISELPPEIFENERQFIIDSISESYRSKNVETRCQVASAIYNISLICTTEEVKQIRLKMMQSAVYDEDPRVRASILRVLERNCTKDLANPDNMKFFQIYVNDDSQRCREIAFNIIANLSKFNPLQTSAITRSSMLDYFFTIRHVVSLRQRSRIIQTLPCLIQASSMTIKAYSAGLMEILMEILNNFISQKQVYENFLEREAETIILIRTVDSFSLLAPLDPDLVSLYSNDMIPLICDFLINTDVRLFQLSILKFFQTLYTAPASTLAYREKAPMILSVCSKLLASTISRKVRMSILKVVGLLGVMEVHQKQPPKTLTAPSNADPELTRQFFHPSRDSDDKVEDILLLQGGASVDQYYTSFSAQALLDVFSDDDLREYYQDTVDALVQILDHPKMWILSIFDGFCSRILTVIEECETNHEIAFYVKALTKLVLSSTHNTSPFLARSLKFIREKFCDELCIEFLELINAFLKSIKDGLSPYASEIICLLMDNLENSHTSNIEVCDRALSGFSVIGLFANDLMYLVVPKICDIIQCDQTLDDVRVRSFETLQELAKADDIMPCMGVLVRALAHGTTSSYEPTQKASMDLVYVLIKAYGQLFFLNAAPLIENIQKNKKYTLELDDLLASAAANESFTPVQNENPKRVQNEQPPKIAFNADIIITQATSLNLGASKQLEKWLRSFIVTLISASTSPKIRCCAQLASLNYPFALQLFKPAFYSCWTQLKKSGINQITNAFRQLLIANERNETVLREIIDVIVFMDKIEKPLDLPVEDIITACIRYGREAYALHLLQKEFETNANSEKSINNLIDIFVQLGDWPDAIGIWKRSLMTSSLFNKVEVMAKLHMWDQVEPLYRQIFEQTKSVDSFIGLSESLASMACWDKVLSLFGTYQKLPSQHQCRCSKYFAEAAMHLGKWDILNDTLKVAPDDNERIAVISAINAIHKGEFKESSEIVTRCFSLLASRPINLWGDNQQIHRNTMIMAQELMEVEELSKWVNLTRNRQSIEDVWNERMKTVPHDFDIWFNLLANRIRITNVRESNIINLFQMKSVTLGTKIHHNAFEVMFPDFKFEEAPDNHKICAVVAHYAIGDKPKAIEEMKHLIDTVSEEYKTQCHYFYANWITENDDSLEVLTTAYEHLKRVVVGKKKSDQPEQRKKRTRTYSNSSMDGVPTKSGLHRTYSSSDKGGLRLSAQVLRSLTTDVTNVDSLRKWADVNTSLSANKSENTTKYVTNAIDALTQCTMITPLFPDIVQLLNLFFENADDPEVFNSTAHACIERLPSKLLLKASPQLLVQLSHPTQAVASFVHEILFKLLSDHYHDLIFSIIVMKFSKNLSRAKAADRLLQQFHQIMPEESGEVELIRKALLRAAVTWYEKVVQRITDAFDHYSRSNYDKMIASLMSIVSMTKKPKCEMHFQFKEKYQDSLTKLENIIQSYNSRNKTAIQQLAGWCQKMQDDIGEKLKEIRMIQLSSISPQLNEKSHFKLAVAGTYKPGKPINRINYFVGQFNVYMSKQQPKDVIVMGEDGCFYQYLLKGHEDLRLDERIMQFFRLINSLLKKETVFQSSLIEVMCVIPLSMSHGLVQWVRGTDTLRNVIESYRCIHNRDPLEEYSLVDLLSTGSFDLMKPIQKAQIIEKIFELLPDTDIADFFWLKSANAEAWLKQINTFSISTAMTSIVGYIIGLGDRHPSNLLIDKFTGKVVHIDFGDCFERAANRPFLPEVVPFRLTRMMVKAMGPTGVDGMFRTTFENMSQVLRENKRVLVMVLAIFVHEPLIDPEADDKPALPLSSGSNENAIPSSSMKYLSKAATGSIIDKGRVYMIDDAGVQSSLEMRNRVKQKLNGQDFDPNVSLSVKDQATRLIQSATDLVNLGKMYSGWCPFW